MNTKTPADRLAVNADGIPLAEMSTSTSSTSWEPETWDLPARPGDDVWAVRENCHPHDIWERSRVTPSNWFNARTGKMLPWRALIAERHPLRRHDFDGGQVWIVRPDAEILAIEVYTNEPAAIAAATRGTNRRVQPWQVLSRPAGSD